jgi:hypothetical protein
MPFEGAVDKYIHCGNIAIFKKRLAETRDESERAVIARLLAEEEAKDAPLSRKSGNSEKMTLNERPT